MSIRSPAAPSLLILIAGIVVLAGASARLYEVERMVIWHDEVFTLVRALGFDGGGVGREVFSGRDLAPGDLLAYQRPSPDLGWSDTLASLKTHPEHSPLYYLLARLAATSSPSPLSGARGVSAALAILLIPAMFWLARELFADAKAAWIGAALAACSPLHLLYAQEARQYALWTLLAAAASAALLRALRRGRGRDWAVYGALVTLGLYSHLLFLLLVAIHGIYLFWSSRSGTGESRVRARAWGTAVGVSLVLFSPWIWLVINRADRVQSVTAWMERPVSAGRLLEAWSGNLTRVFADLPDAPAILFVGLALLAWAVWRFCLRAPASARLFLCMLFLSFAAVVLVPDLIGGGQRSLHPRYVLPGFLALQLMLAYVLAADWDAPSAARRVAARSALAVVLGAGLASQWQILRADTWWSKNFSSLNRQVARLVNDAERPLVLINYSGVGLGEAVSLARYLRDGVVIRSEPGGGEPVSLNGYSDIFLLTPSAELRAALSGDYDLVSVLGTWQWFRAVPRAGGAGT